jgi:hypothetical protein
MDIEQYNKISELISSGNYSKLNKAPATTIERKVYNTLKKYKDNITDKLRSNFTPHCSTPPHLYGLPKIYKNGIPLWPIVSSRNSPCQPLAKHILKILSPLVGNMGLYVKNSEHFISKIKNLELQQNDTLMGFDIL